MKEKMFAELVESIEEGGAILRGQRKPSRVFKYPSQGAPSAQTVPFSLHENQDMETTRNEVFAICIATDDTKLLQTRKLYFVTLLSNDLLSLVDEEGETAVYPTDQFILIELPREVEDALTRVA